MKQSRPQHNQARMRGSAKTQRVSAANNRCPMSGTAIDPEDMPIENTATFQGQTIGFCSDLCISEWEQLSEEEKQDLLNDVSQ